MKRSEWVAFADRLVRPVLRSAAQGRLGELLKPEHHPNADPARLRTSALETMGRTLAGIGPWLDATGLDADEERVRGEFAAMTRTALSMQSDPRHPDYLNFVGPESQTLVDAAFLAQGFLRGPRLWESLDADTKRRIHDGFVALRNRKPGFNNWLLFSAMTEAFLAVTGGQGDLMRIDYAIRQHEQWYLGDGVYADGPRNHVDYYNSFVIHPMLTDILLAVGGIDPEWGRIHELQKRRHARSAELQERMIAPDGSWPVIGRSIAYRCGAFQTLAHAAVLHLLPATLSPARVRCALSATIERSLGPSASWRDDGFLAIGLAGHQPSLGEAYITTGSLYLAACVLLPLGLPPTDPFWSQPDEPWTSVRAWDLVESLSTDHALHE